MTGRFDSSKSVKGNENQIPYETVEIWKLGRIDRYG